MSTVVDEVTPSPQDPEPKSLQNGLGLEQLLPKKPSPPKDPVTGKFLKADGSPGVAKPKGETKPPDTPVDPLETLNKRLKDTRDYATRVDQENKGLKERLKVLEAKIDGTYIEPTGPSPEQQAELERYWERVKVDSKVLAEAYGEETLQARIFAEGSPYRELEQADPLITERLKRAERPVLEAWKILDKYEFEQKYGSEPDAIKAAIIKEYQAQQHAELAAEIKGHKPTIESVSTLAGLGGVPRDKTPKPAGGMDLKKVFPLFPQGYAQ
jgi:hypothetical protein